VIREKILLAIYNEFLKGNNDMRNIIQPETLDVATADFCKEIQHLQSEGLIYGAVLIRDRDDVFPYRVILRNVVMTFYGLAYVKQHLLAQI